MEQDNRGSRNRNGNVPNGNWNDSKSKVNWYNSDNRNGNLGSPKFLRKELFLELHPSKITIRKLTQGIDFLGYVVLPYYRVLRTKTKNRMFRKIRKLVDKETNADHLKQSQASYLGMLSHCKGGRIANTLYELTNNV